VSARSELRGTPVRVHSMCSGGRLAVCGGDPRRHDARGRVGGTVPWLEVPVHVEALLSGNGGTWIYKDAPWCGAGA
jgi:hypothetical protein